MPESPPNSQSRPFRRIASLIGLVTVGVGVVWWLRSQQNEMPSGVMLSQYKRAAESYQERYQTTPSRSDVLTYLGELSVTNADLELAANCFRAIPLTDEKHGLSARHQLGLVLIKMKHAREAEQAFREFLAAAENSRSGRKSEIAMSLRWLRYMMSVQLRFEERAAILQQLDRLGEASSLEALQQYFPHLLLWRTEKGRGELQHYLEKDPDNPLLLIAQGRYLIGEGRLEEARHQLEHLAKQRPADLNCLAALLECYYELDDWESFEAVLQQLPPDTDQEPWLLLLMKGEFALHQKDWNEAVIEFEKLLSEEPADITACLGLSLAYSKLDNVEQSEYYQERTRVLARIRPKLVQITGANSESFEELAAECELIGFNEAAQAFRKYADWKHYDHFQAPDTNCGDRQ